MTLFRIEIDAHVVDDHGQPWADPETLARKSDEVMAELIRINVGDPFVHANLKNAHVTMSLTVERDTELDALEHAVTSVRCAVHAVGGSTPGWERNFRNLRPVAEELQPV